MNNTTRYDITKGQLDAVQEQALVNVLDTIAEKAAADRAARPDTRGHYGLPGSPAAEANPTGFRNPRLPRA